MGLSIHYNGRFNPAASLPALIEEVTDIAEIYKWKYTVCETEFESEKFGKKTYNDKIYGIIFSPPKCEPVCLCFLSNGRMSTPWNLELWGNSEDKKEKKYLYMISTKTQYAGMQAHLTVIQMLKYLSQKYFSEFELSDEGGYWETGDIHVLTESFKRYNDLIDAFADMLENEKIKKGETMEDYFMRVLKQIQENKKKEREE
jgi:hypothetical protein